MERRIEAGDAPYREPEPDPQWRKDLGSPQVSTMPTDSHLWTWNLNQQHRRIEVKHAHSDQASTPDHLRRLRRTRGSAFYGWRACRTAPRCIKLPNGEIRVRRVDLEKWLENLEDNK